MVMCHFYCQLIRAGVCVCRSVSLSLDHRHHIHMWFCQCVLSASHTINRNINCISIWSDFGRVGFWYMYMFVVCMRGENRAARSLILRIIIVCTFKHSPKMSKRTWTMEGKSRTKKKSNQRKRRIFYFTTTARQMFDIFSLSLFSRYFFTFFFLTVFFSFSSLLDFRLFSMFFNGESAEWYFTY